MNMNPQANPRQLKMLKTGKIQRIGRNVQHGRCPNGEGIRIFRRMLATAVKGTCLLWPYAKGGQGQYGQVHDGPKKLYTHHLAWIHTFGPIPPGQHILHHCDTPRCFNPFCLFTGTELDNKADQKAKGRTCVGSKNGYSKLTEQQVKEIRELYRRGVRGFGQEALGKRFGVHRVNIKKIVERKIWKHV
jgi:hypothetical protein